MTEPQPDLSAYRQSVVGLVRTLASSEEQLEYQRKVAWLDVSQELVAQWFDDMYQPEDERWRALFTEFELSALEVLNREFSRAAEHLPAGSTGRWPTDPNWKRVMSAAAVALSAFSTDSLSRGKQ